MTPQEIFLGIILMILLVMGATGVLSSDNSLSKADLIALEKDNERKEKHLAFIQHSTREVVRLAQAKLDALESGDKELYQTLCLERDYLEHDYHRKCRDYELGL